MQHSSMPEVERFQDIETKGRRRVTVLKNMAMNAGMTLSMVVMVVLATAVGGSTPIEGIKGDSPGSERGRRDDVRRCCIEFMACHQQCRAPRDECWNQCWQETPAACKARASIGHCIAFQACHHNCDGFVHDCLQVCEYEAKYKHFEFRAITCKGFLEAFGDCMSNTELPAKYYCFHSNKDVAC